MEAAAKTEAPAAEKKEWWRLKLTYSIQIIKNGNKFNNFIKDPNPFISTEAKLYNQHFTKKYQELVSTESSSPQFLDHENQLKLS